MAKRIGLLFGTLVFALIVRNCTAVECLNELFIKLDDDKLSLDDIEETLRGVKNNREAKIGEILVADIWSYKTSSCSREGVLAQRFLDFHVFHFCLIEGTNEIKINQGVDKFINHYRAKLYESCRENILARMGEVMKKLSDIQKEHLNRLADLNEYRMTRAMSRSCNSLYHAMLGPMRCHQLKHFVSMDPAIARLYRMVNKCGLPC